MAARTRTDRDHRDQMTTRTTATGCCVHSLLLLWQDFGRVAPDRRLANLFDLLDDQGQALLCNNLDPGAARGVDSAVGELADHDSRPT